MISKCSRNLYKAAPAGWGRDPPLSRHTRLSYSPTPRGRDGQVLLLGIEVKVSPLASVFLQNTPGKQLAYRDQGPDIHSNGQ